MSTIVQHGFLIIADISGYTSFVAKTELEHSHEILSELLGLLVDRFQPLMTVLKLEGDAVFAFTGDRVFARGTTLIDFVESMYVAFRDTQVSMLRRTTCACKACRNISTLDLKFFIHCGNFIQQKIADKRELIGSDVNLIHRLTKNHVTEATGWRAYMLFTDQCLAKLQLTLTDAHLQLEEYEYLGEIKTHNVNLHQRYKEITEQRRILLEEKDADMVLRVDFPTPPSVTRERIQDPDKRNQWNGRHVHWSQGERPKGRAGVAASNHCAHRKSVSTEVVVDWRPFEYVTTNSFENGRHMFTETVRFEPLPNGGTRVHDVMRMYLPMPQFLRRLGARFVLICQHHMDERMQAAARMAGKEFAESQGE